MIDKVFYKLRTDVPYFKYMLLKIGMSEEQTNNYIHSHTIINMHKIYISIDIYKMYGWMPCDKNGKSYMLRNGYTQHKIRLTEKELEELELIKNVNTYNL